jgi:hypothetical protein
VVCPEANRSFEPAPEVPSSNEYAFTLFPVVQEKLASAPGSNESAEGDFKSASTISPDDPAQPLTDPDALQPFTVAAISVEYETGILLPFSVSVNVALSGIVKLATNESAPISCATPLANSM